MIDSTNESCIELAHRSSAELDVTLIWVCGRNEKILVCVRDRQNGAYFEIPVEPYLALDVYYHPFTYRDFRTVEYGASRLAA